MMIRDDQWFEGLYRRHRSAIQAYCARRVGFDAAPDATAEVFSVAWRRRDDLPEPDRALPWLYGVARNVVSHQWRGARRRRRLAERLGSGRSLASAPASDDALVRDEHRAVRSAVSQLAPVDREVLLLKAWEGLDHDQIAQVLSCSRAAVDKRVTRAKARLAKRYTAIAGEPTLGTPAERRRVPNVRGRRGGDRP